MALGWVTLCMNELNEASRVQLCGVVLRVWTASLSYKVPKCFLVSLYCLYHSTGTVGRWLFGTIKS